MPMNSLLPFLEFGASSSEAAMTVILMHGLGADGHDFADVAEALVHAAEPKKWRFVLPHSPEIPVTINAGMVVPGWYDILDMNHPREVDWETVAKSTGEIEALMAAESAQKLVLAGFSQGGAMALHVGLRNQASIAGILVMSGYLLESEQHPCPAKDKDFSIGIFHGDADLVVPYSAAEQTVATLKQNGYLFGFKSYPGLEHSVSEEEIRDVFAWLNEVL